MTTLSLRQRFVLIVCLALVALGAAAVAMAQLRAQTRAAREEAAAVESDALLDALLAALREARGGAGVDTPEARASAQRFAESLVAPLLDASAGYCAGDGAVLVSATGPTYHGAFENHDAPAGLSRHEGLLPLDRRVVATACQEARADGVARTRAELPRDILVVSARASTGGAVAWTLIRLAPSRPKEEGPGWMVNVVALAVASLVLLFLAADALLALRRGAGDLELAIARLRANLRADIPQPRTAELARVASGLRTMAAHLADADDHRRALERRLSHEHRLAALGRVIAGVAHEVRNPLTGIKLKLDAMARRRIDERSARDVATCLEEIARLDHVIHSLLFIARKGTSASTEVELGELLTERLERAALLAASRSVRLVREGTATVRGNRDELTRVLDNLVRNAIEASPPDAEVRVMIEPAPDATRVTVCDSGSGVPSERLPELFEPFFTLKPDGTGLGLFLAVSLVEARGGQLTYARVRSSTRFTVTLPLDRTDAEPASHPDR